MLTNTEKLQKRIENSFSTKGVWKLIEDSINQNHALITTMADAIKVYLSKRDYYTSKQIRVNTIQHHPRDLAIIICVAILKLQKISPIQAVVAIIGQQLNYAIILDGIKTGAELLAVCELVGLYTLVRASSQHNMHETLEVHSHFEVSQETRDKLTLMKYLPPMLCPPIPWTDNTDGGSLTSTKESIVLRPINNHNKQQNLDAINTLQTIAWTINSVFDYEEDTDKELDTTTKAQQHKHMVKESNQVCSDLINQGNKFYFVWKYDSRGRMYNQGYHCHLQGAQYKRAILSFANKEHVTK